MLVGYGSFIKKHRIDSGYSSQRQLALVSELNRSTLSRIEKELSVPDFRTVKTLAFYLTSTTLEELLTVCGYDPNARQGKFDIEIANKETLEKYNLKIDNAYLTEEELKGFVAYVRSLRSLKNDT